MTGDYLLFTFLDRAKTKPRRFAKFDRRAVNPN
jgi:hypothetical protein